MRIVNSIGLILILVLLGCASVSSMQRLEVFEEQERSYRLALRDSDFKTAIKFVDMSTQTKPVDIDEYRKFKVALYKSISTQFSENKKEILQEVEIQYYHQIQPRLKTIQDNQVWVYHLDKKAWLLKSGLPKFE